MVKMAKMPIYDKNLKKSFSPKQLGWLPWNFVCSIRWLSSTKFVQMVTLGWPWPIFRECQICSLWLLNREKVKHCIFPKQWYSVIWKKVLHAPHFCEYQRPKSFSDLGQRSLGLNVLTFSNDFSSEPTGPISVQFHIRHPGNVRLKICSNGLGLMDKMATMPIYGKNF